eukprot:g20198.t1
MAKRPECAVSVSVSMSASSAECPPLSPGPLDGGSPPALLGALSSDSRSSSSDKASRQGQGQEAPTFSSWAKEGEGPPVSASTASASTAEYPPKPVRNNGFGEPERAAAGGVLGVSKPRSDRPPLRPSPPRAPTLSSSSVVPNAAKSSTHNHSISSNSSRGSSTSSSFNSQVERVNKLAAAAAREVLVPPTPPHLRDWTPKGDGTNDRGFRRERSGSHASSSGRAASPARAASNGGERGSNRGHRPDGSSFPPRHTWEGRGSGGGGSGGGGSDTADGTKEAPPQAGPPPSSLPGVGLESGAEGDQKMPLITTAQEDGGGGRGGGGGPSFGELESRDGGGLGGGGDADRALSLPRKGSDGAGGSGARGGVMRGVGTNGQGQAEMKPVPVQQSIEPGRPLGEMRLGRSTTDLENMHPPSQLRQTSKYLHEDLAVAKRRQNQRARVKRRKRISFADEHGDPLYDTEYWQGLYYSKEGVPAPRNYERYGPGYSSVKCSTYVIGKAGYLPGSMQWADRCSRPPHLATSAKCIGSGELHQKPLPPRSRSTAEEVVVAATVANNVTATFWQPYGSVKATATATATATETATETATARRVGGSSLSAAVSASRACPSVSVAYGNGSGVTGDL